MDSTKTYELASWDGDSYEHVGDYSTRLEAYRAAKSHGPGDYALGRAESGQYDESVRVHEDGDVLAAGGAAQQWYPVDLADDGPTES